MFIDSFEYTVCKPIIWAAKTSICTTVLFDEKFGSGSNALYNKMDVLGCFKLFKADFYMPNLIINSLTRKKSFKSFFIVALALRNYIVMGKMYSLSMFDVFMLSNSYSIFICELLIIEFDIKEYQTFLSGCYTKI